QIPQQLFGREEELATLLKTFDRVALGSVECLLVSGYAGIGKSALVQELHKPITARRGYFISGKFDLLQRDIPYVALTQAFDQLMRELLTESEERLKAWRQKLSTVLGGNGQLLIDLIPALEWVIGPQPVIQGLDEQEARNRLHHLLQNFVKLFARAQCPLVIFIDDLQWADSGSLKLLEVLLTSFGLKHLLVIGAYRDNEVNEGHALRQMVKQLEEEQVKVKRLSVGPLTIDDVSRLLAATLHQSVARVQALAHLVFNKTGGNPFFTLEFLKALHGDDLLTFTSPRADGKGGGWQWELPHIEARSMSDNVVELMVAKVKQLPQQTQLSLQLAACIGNLFTLQTLALVSEQTPQAVVANLSEALQVGLIIPLDDDYKYIAALNDVAHMKVEYKFAHDRVQQAAYTLIEPAKRQAFHWQIGQLLLAQIPHEQQEERIFDIVNHLNQGRSLLESGADRYRLIDLNLKAGRRAMAAAAHDSALVYFQVGVTLLPENTWHTDHKLSIHLYTLAAEAAYLLGAFDKMEQFSETVLQQACTPLDQAKIFEFRTDFYQSQGQLAEAARTALHALNLFGLDIPIHPKQSDVEHGMQEVKTVLADLGPTLDIQLERLLNHEEMTDPTMLAALNILDKGQPAAFWYDAKLMFLILVAGFKLSIQYGLSAATARILSFYASYLCGQGDIKTGYQIGQFVLKLEKRHDIFASAIARYYIDALVTPWKEHIRHTLSNILVDHQPMLESGQLYRAGISLQVYCHRSLAVGTNLEQLEQEMVLYGSTLKQLKQVRTLELFHIFWLFVRNLCGTAPIGWQLDSESFDLEKLRIRWLETKNVNGLMTVYMYQCMLSYLFERFPLAAEQATSAEPYLDVHTFGPPTPSYYLYDSLARLAVYFDLPTTEQKYVLDRVNAHQSKMRYWAEHAPMNFRHKYLLVEAELARVLDNDSQAREYYDQSIELAHEHQYINEEALAYEVAARFYLAKGNLTISHLYLREAHYAYQCWGATAKVKDLESRYPEVFAPRGSYGTRPHRAQSTTDSPDLTGRSQYGSAIIETIDLEAVTKAAQAISGEVVLDKLLTKLMQTVRENAGAEKAILLEARGPGNDLLIQAKSLGDHEIEVLMNEQPG
ncbi:MAG: AAA family ATPase, partial [Gammaproteobacteria bacterium]|nr:AAA family ATPase [Gammaproteobacteria bacterium]